MKALVVFDSLYGNTEKVAKAIGNGLGSEAKVLSVGQVDSLELRGFDLLVVGSPTHGGRPTKPIKDFLNLLPKDIINSVRVAAFDTRVLAQGGFVNTIVNFFGYAAPAIAKALQSKGAHLAAAPEGFAVNGKEGPLKEGELERAQEWAKKLNR